MQAIELSHKSSLYWRSMLIIPIVILLLSLQSCGAANKNGAATPEKIVDGYLSALEDRNENALRRLMPEESIAAPEIAAKIAKFGGHKIRERQVEYLKSKPTLWNAKLRGSYIDRAGVKYKFDDSIAIEYQSKGQVKLYGGRWYLLL
ncbi:hypothetical protein [Chamaesiphon sp. OTE_8_metabat_110]|uniref:hypothetical protein n=1 Tax=Chamaesiphon sp. OTE_8_metabat_110 TaxID=2964696 RepID=UPI00286A19D7|nr:hypothetical protein [Chamaesiphon sp. OTE_8_metabat_110]